jgi:hypothetical protein
MAKPDFKFTLKKFGAAFAWDVEVNRKPAYVGNHCESGNARYEFVFNNKSHKIFGLTDHLLVTRQNSPQEFDNVRDVANQYLNNFYMREEEESKTAQRSLLFRGERFA